MNQSREFGQQRHSREDHDCPHHEGSENTPKQNLMLILFGEAQRCESDGEDKDVTHAERFLDQAGGEELNR